MVACNRKQLRRQDLAAFLHTPHIPAKVDRVDLDHQLKRKRQRIQELGLRCQQLLLLRVVNFGQ